MRGSGADSHKRTSFQMSWHFEKQLSRLVVRDILKGTKDEMTSSFALAIDTLLSRFMQRKNA